MKNLWKLILIILLACSPVFAESNLELWITDFKNAVKTVDIDKIKPFFSDTFRDAEIETWKYSIKSGNLNYKKMIVHPLSKNDFLLYIPTNNDPYSNKDGDTYFDFIYRIYRLEQQNGKLVINERCMDHYNPDFLLCESEIDVHIDEKAFYIKNKSKIRLKSEYLIFKLAKEFEIDEFLFDNHALDYTRIGYIVFVKIGNKDSLSFSLKGKIRSPKDNNQFMSVDSTNFFLRIGGFAALPSPPPDNNGRYHFSKDETYFNLTYIFPDNFTLVQYGETYREQKRDGKSIISAKSNGPWLDNIAFYSQNNWQVEIVRTGNANLTFYFPKENAKELSFLTSEVNKLLEWSYTIFKAYPDPNINFIILDKFYIGGALNDSRSIITQNAEIMCDDTYIHEILHLVPQPQVTGNYLWIKEGFTNFLSFNFIEFKDSKSKFWEKQKRQYLHYFDLYEEPLIALTNTRMPTYWAAYQKAPWVYRMLKEVVGEENFDAAMLEFAKMKGQKLQSVRNYFEIFERISGKDLIWFEEQWLYRKENPVVNVTSQYETNGNDGLVRIRIWQTGNIFKFPLEVEINSENRSVRKTIWIDSGYVEHTVPVNERVKSVRYDPDSKLFALLKTKTLPFIKNDKILHFSEQIAYRFKSCKTNEIVEYCIEKAKDQINIASTNKDGTACLTMSKNYCPIEFKKNGETVYTIDTDSMLIHFKDTSFQIAESVYPSEFIPVLFSMVNWELTKEESLLYLRQNSKRCAAAQTTVTKIANDTFQLNIQMYYKKVSAIVKNGQLVEFTIDDDETFEVI